jgi:hypothetical protein
MATLIKIRRSSVGGKQPTTVQLEVGELAINTYDGKLFSKKSVGGTESIFEIGATGYTGSQGVIGYTGSKGDIGYAGSKGDIGYVGSVGYTGSRGVLTTTTSSSPPGSPNLGDIWIDSNTGTQYFYIYDGDSNQWVELANAGTIGVTGYTGSRGLIGYTGSAGSTGYTGSQGSTGYTGSAGTVDTAATYVWTNNHTFSANISGNTAGFTIGYLDVPQNFTNTSFTIALTDRGKHIYTANGTAQIITIANNSSVAFPVGSAISIVSQGAGTITVARGSGVTLYLAANSTSADRTIAAYGMATLLKVATDTWFINGAGVT